MRKPHTVNSKFFSGWSPEMAYFLGYIYADGSMDKCKYRVRIASSTREILDELANLIEYSGPLSEESNQNGSWYSLGIQNKAIYGDLRSLGLQPNKSTTMRMPDVPDEHMPHFVRGYFDGDGCIYEQKRPRPTPGAYTEIVTGSKQFAQELLAILHKGVHSSFRLRNPRKNYYSIRGSNIATEALYTYMYQDHTICLQRKFNKFQDLWIKKNKLHLVS